MMAFSLLPAVKKTPFLEQLKQIFGPSYFVTAALERNDGSNALWEI
jgi:hypothetical protein